MDDPIAAVDLAHVRFLPIEVAAEMRTPFIRVRCPACGFWLSGRSAAAIETMLTGHAVHSHAVDGITMRQ